MKPLWKILSPMRKRRPVSPVREGINSVVALTAFTAIYREMGFGAEVSAIMAARMSGFGTDGRENEAE